MKKSIPILCYQSISPVCGVPPDEFRGHLRWLYKNGYRPITLEQMIAHLRGEKEVPGGAVVLTFEDCYLDNWVYAVPILKEFGAHAAFGCITGFLHDAPSRPQSDSVTVDLRSLPMTRDAWMLAFEKNDYRAFMSRAEVRRLVEEFGHEIFGHTHTHQMCFRSDKPLGEVNDGIHPGVHGIYVEVRDGLPMYARGSAYAYNGFWPESNNLLDVRLLPRSTDERIEFCLGELMLCRERLESLLAHPVRVMSWPWGEYDDVAVKAAALAGYEAAFSMDYGANVPGTPLFAIRRFQVKGVMPPKDFGSRIRKMSNPLLARLGQKIFQLAKGAERS